MRGVCQNRREIIKALFVFGAFGTLASSENFRAALHRIRNLRFDLLALRLGMHRAEPSVLVHPVSDLEPLHFSNNLFNELSVDALDHIQPLHSEACLPAIVETTD